MKAACKWMLLLVLFHLDVRVRADLSSPRNCWPVGGECAIQTSSPATFKHHDAVLNLGRESVLKRNAEENLNLIEGVIWVASESESVEFLLANGRLWVEPHSKLELVRTDRGFGLKVLEGLVRFQALESKETLLFPQAYQVHLGWMNSEGQAAVELPQSLSLVDWTRLFHHFYKELPPAELKAKLQKDLKSWQSRVEEATRLQQAHAERVIAEDREARQKAARAKARREAENRKLRALFRKKNHFD